MYRAVDLPTVTAVAGSVSTVEFGLLAAAAVLLVLLVLVKAKREHDQKLRRAASVGYFDLDAARYGQGAPFRATEGVEADASHLPLAPTFVATSRPAAANPSAPVPPPPPTVPSAFGGPAGGPPRAVPPFDPLGAVGARPASTAAAPGRPSLPPLGLPPPPDRADTDGDIDP